MHCLRDASAIHHFLHSCRSPELHQLIHAHLDTLMEIDDVQLGDLFTFLILEDGDSASTLNVPLGRNIEDSPIETCLNFSEWFELVIIVSDDGFGYVVFIPKNIADQSLLNFCISRSARTLDDGS